MDVVGMARTSAMGARGQLHAQASRASRPGARLANCRNTRSRSSRQAVHAARAQQQQQQKTVADTRKAFLTEYPFPLPSPWSSVINELLVQQHLYNQDRRYHYSKLSALGLVSIFDQIMEGFPREGAAENIFAAFFHALDEDPSQFRTDHDQLMQSAQSMSSVDELKELDALSELKQRADNGTYFYSKFQAVGLFKLLELVGSTDPNALQQLADAAGMNIDKINSDLQTYKSTLSKLSQAREMQQENIKRDRQKREERQQAQQQQEGSEEQSGKQEETTSTGAQ